MPNPDPPIDTDTVLLAELDKLGVAPPPAPTLAARIDRLPEPLAALCLSGGGIRSAAFALGVLQGLARFGVLEHFQYLSTVSGGGYIGSFLSAWRLHAPDDAAVFAGLDRTSHPDGAEAPEIGGLRAHSNYLTPRLGLLSADTWTVVALYVRNLLLNWLVFLPFFAGVLCFPWVCNDVLEAAAFWPRGAEWALAGIAILALILGLSCASYGRRRAAGLWLTDGLFIRLVLLPVILAAMALTTAAAVRLGQPQDAALSPWLGAPAGACCYAAIWLLASAAERRAHPASDLEAGWVSRRSWLKDWLAWAASGGIVGVVMLLGPALYASSGRAPGVLAVFGLSWVMLSVLLGELLYVGLRSYSVRGDMDREWLARAAGWLTAAAVTWALVASLALFAPFALIHGTTSAVAVLTAGGVSGLITILLGASAKTAATEATQLARTLSLTQLASLAGLVFAVFVCVLLSFLDIRLFFALDQGGVPGWMIDLACLVVLIAAGVGISWFVNVNRFSLHAVYRDRLVLAFLGSARARAQPGRRPDPFTGFDQDDNPPLASLPRGPGRQRLLHVVNITLNLVAADNLAWQQRKAEAFTITPLHAGNPRVGYRPSIDYGGGRGGITLGTAMAISGAAVSPNMGYASSPLLGVLLMLCNVRLGWWLGNPRYETYRRAGPTLGIVPALQELAGATNDRGRWIYLSDGGHFDNLGLYEMIRRRCRLIVVSDAGCDPGCTLADLGDSLRKIYIDFGVSIDFESFDIAARATPPAPGCYAAIATITYPGSGPKGWLLYIKPGLHGEEPAHVLSYALAHASFPHESTAEQWFSESQFEAYRALGAHATERICNGGASPNAGARPETLSLDTFRQRATGYIAATRRKASP